MPTALANPQARRIVVASGIAVAATTVAVSTGVAGSAGAMHVSAAATVNASNALNDAAYLDSRTQEFSRSLDRLTAVTASKAAALSGASGAAVTQSADLTPKSAPVAKPVEKTVALPSVAATSVEVSPGTAQAIALQLMPSYGMSASQFSCLDRLWNRESGWNVSAANASGAYGIPQALPGSKMSSAGSDWESSATTQIKWGLGYIQSRYGSACGAWEHSLSSGWY